jgi:hypothetical protein
MAPLPSRMEETHGRAHRRHLTDGCGSLGDCWVDLLPLRPYPGFRPMADAIEEYIGKLMSLVRDP